jgi:hypothetical protein
MLATARSAWLGGYMWFWMKRILLAATTFCALRSGARADEQWGFVQITCAPEISYFAVKRFQIYNPPNMGPYLSEGLSAGEAQIKTLQKKYGIYSSDSLSKHPFECVIPPIKPVPGWGAHVASGFTAKVVGHIDTDDTKTSYRQIIDNVEVFRDGNSVSKLHLNPYGFTVGTSSVEISSGTQPDLIQIVCALPDNVLINDRMVGDGEISRCKETWVPPDSPN